MGFLDWLTEGIGSDMGGGTPTQPGPGSQMGGMDPMGNPTGQSMPLPTPAPAPTQAMPPPQQLGTDAPSLDPMVNDIGGGMQGGSPPPPPINPATSDIAGGMQGGSPPLPPVPMPAPRPPGANAPPPMPPPGAAPPGPLPPGPPQPLSPQDAGGIAQSYQNAGGNLAPPAAPAAPAGASGFIGRALGLDANREASLRGSLGAGLKAAGENANKPGLAALAGSAGSAIEGGKAANDKGIDQQSKYLNDAIKAQQAGDTGKLNVARTRLALAQAKAAETGKDTKASVMNSPEQLYLRGLGAVNQSQQVKASAAQLKQLQAQNDPDSPVVKAAIKAHNDLIENTKKQVFATLGVSEKDATEMGKKPGFSSDNPVPSAGLTKEKFDALPPGAYFINPKDNRLLIKQPPTGASPTPQAQSPTPASPVPITAPAGSIAAQENDD